MKNIITSLLGYSLMVAVGLGTGLSLKYGWDWYNQIPDVVETDTKAHFLNTDNQVVIYTTQWCPYCKRTKAYLKEHNISYTERDIEQGDAKINALFDSIGYPGVPKILIGNKIVNGFNEFVITAELKSHHLL